MYMCVCVCMYTYIHTYIYIYIYIYKSLCSQGSCSFGKPDEFLERIKKLKVFSIRTQLHINKTETLNL